MYQDSNEAKRFQGGFSTTWPIRSRPPGARLDILGGSCARLLFLDRLSPGNSPGTASAVPGSPSIILTTPSRILGRGNKFQDPWWRRPRAFPGVGGRRRCWRQNPKGLLEPLAPSVILVATRHYRQRAAVCRQLSLNVPCAPDLEGGVNELVQTVPDSPACDAARPVLRNIRRQIQVFLKQGCWQLGHDSFQVAKNRLDRGL